MSYLPTPGPGDVWGTQLNAVIRELAAPFDEPPSAPNPRNDEFTGTALDAKWNRGPVSFNDRVAEGRLEMSGAGEGKSYILFQNLATTSPMSITAKLGGYSDEGDLRVGIFLGNTDTPRAMLAGMTCSPNDTRWGMGIEITSNFATATDWGSYSGEWSSDRGGIWSGKPIWYRLTWTGQMLEVYLSPNGRTWRWIYSRPQATAPNRMGLAMYANSGNVPLRSMTMFEWVRFHDSATPDVTQSFTRTWAKDGYNGIFDALGRIGNGSMYENPALMGRVVASMSSQNGANGSYSAEKALSQVSTDLPAHTSDGSNQWWKVDLGPTKTATVNRYAIRGASPSNLPRNFQLEGSNDDSTWTVLHAAGNNGPVTPLGWWSAAVDSAAAYRYLRIIQTGSNSSGNGYLISTGVEFWGTVNVVS